MANTVLQYISMLGGGEMNFSMLISHLRNNWRPVVGTHLLFTLLGITLLTPLFGAALQLLVSLSGSAAVADQDIALLLISPLGMLSGVFMTALLLAIAGLELGALQTVARAAHRGLRITAIGATTYSLKRAADVLRLTLHLTLRILAYLLPYLAAVGAVAWYLLGDHDINYYLSKRPTDFYVALVIAGMFTLVLVWLLGRRLLRWCLILPLVLFGGIRPPGSFTASARLTAGRLGYCLRALLVWAVLALALAMVPALFLKLCMAALVGSGVQSLQQLVLLLGLAGVIWSVLGFLVAAFNLGLFTLVIGGLYEDTPEAVEDRDFARAVHRQGPRFGFAAVALIVAALAAAGLSGGLALLGGIGVADHSLVIAHRGAAGSAPENTLAAVERAISDGTDWVEIDVQETRDGHVVVVHDSDFMKLAGNPLKVWEGDLAEIRQIDVGSWFAPEFAGQKVPTLEEVLAAVRGRSRLVIELKYYGHDQQLEQRVVDIVESMGMADQVVVMSLKLPGIERLKALRPEWTAGLLAATALGDLTRLDVDFLAVNQKLATPAFIKRAHDSGKGVYVWTVDDGLSLSRWMSMGVDGVITNEPALAKDILAQRADLSSAERLLLSLITLFGKPELARQYRDNSP